MMTQQLGFSVLTAPIAAIDRRALSQAWYSTLHLATQQPSKQETPRLRVAVERRTLHRANVPVERRTNAFGTVPALQARPVKSVRGDVFSVDRRSSRSPLARKIEHTFLRPNIAAPRAAFTIDGTAARVHVTMQRTRSGLHLVAVCPPHVRVSVARALEEARYALAERGIAIDARISE